jgi:hypothetical protein
LESDGRLALVGNVAGGPVWVADEQEVTAETLWTASGSFGTDLITTGPAIEILGRLALPGYSISLRNLQLRRSFTTNPVEFSPASSWATNLVDASGDVGGASTLVALGDRIVIVYPNHTTGKLKVAIAQTRY